MFIAGNKVLLRAVEEETFEQTMELLKGKFWIGTMSRLIWESRVKNLSDLLGVLGSRELSPGRLMVVAPEKKRGFYGLLLIEQADWKNGVLSISVYPSEGSGQEMADGLSALIRFGFDEMRMECAMVSCTGEDQAVAKICREAGLQQDACLKSRLCHDGERMDMAVFTLPKKGTKEE